MKFSCSIHFALRDAPKDYSGLSSCWEHIGKEPLEIGYWLYVIVRSAMNFALDCGLSTDDANKGLDYLRNHLTGVEITEQSDLEKTEATR